IRVAGSSDGRNCPWHSGQSGQPRPDPVTRTMPPHTTTRNDATRLAYTSARYGRLGAGGRSPPTLVRDVFLQRTGAVHDRDAREVVGLRWRRRRPLERVGLPRVVARGSAVAEHDAVEEVEEEHRDRDADDVGADRRDEVQ